MKAMLLAAGQGTRLRPLTNEIPKCMLPVGGKPVLQHNIEWLRGHGVVDLVVNLHHLPERVTGYFGDGKAFGVRIQYSPESELMGTAGAIWQAREFFQGERFWVVYADNLFDCDLSRIYQNHLSTSAILSMALFWREDVSASGEVDLDEDGRITAFKEKPAPNEVPSHWVNAGLYLCEPEVLEFIPAGKFSDFGKDVLPAMLASGRRLSGYIMGTGESLDWIDTLDDMLRTNARWSKERSL